MVRCFTHTLWREMSALIPRVTPEAKSKLSLVEEVMKMWIRYLDDYRDLNWRTKPFGYAERTNVYTDKIEEVKGILVLFE